MKARRNTPALASKRLPRRPIRTAGLTNAAPGLSSAKSLKT